jgi:hypothetical protein
VRYFYYLANHARRFAVVVDEDSESVTFHPHQRTGSCSVRKADWLDYYAGLNEEGRKTSMFEICENQFKKFAIGGVEPENHDPYFVAQRRKAQV